MFRYATRDDAAADAGGGGEGGTGGGANGGTTRAATTGNIDVELATFGGSSISPSKKMPMLAGGSFKALPSGPVDSDDEDASSRAGTNISSETDLLSSINSVTVESS